MIAVLEDQPIGLHRLPEGDVVERVKPVPHILNVFEDDHNDSLPSR